MKHSNKFLGSVILNIKFIPYLKFLTSIIGIIALIVLLGTGVNNSPLDPASNACIKVHDCSLTVSNICALDSDNSPLEHHKTNDNDTTENEKEKENEKEEKKAGNEDALVDILHTVPSELMVVRTYFHHHSAIISLVVLDKPTQPPKTQYC